MKKIAINSILSFATQFLIMALGLIVPRLVLTNYGSEVNGFLNTVTQVFAYLVLLEAGIGQATRIALYQPIISRDRKTISEIMTQTVSNYRKNAIIYAVGVVVFSLVLAFGLKTSLGKWTIIGVVLMEGASGILRFCFSAPKSLILTSEGKEYINNIISTFTRIGTYVVKIILVLLNYNIVAIQAGYLVCEIIRQGVYCLYFHKKYPWINYNTKSKNNYLIQRKDFVVTEVAWTVFSATPVIAVSFFCGVIYSSVYSVYNLVYSSLSTIISTVYISTFYVLGQEYSKEKNRYVMVHDSFESIFMSLIFGALTVSYWLILPFVRLYTDGVADVNYIDPWMPLLFCLVQMLSWGRYVSGNLTGLAHHAKEMGKASIIETAINLILTLFLVQIFKMRGVLIATVVALLTKSIYVIWFANRKILNRSTWHTYSTLILNYLLFGIIGVVGSNIFILEINNYIDFFKYGVLLSTVIFPVFVLFGVLKQKKAIFSILKSRKGWVN